MLNFCTVFDEVYYSKGLALIHSIKRWMPTAKCHVLFTSDFKIDIPDVSYLSKTADQQITDALYNRTWKEFCWTLASWWSWRVLRKFKSVTYVDADSFFFGSIEKEPFMKADIAICPHRWTPRHISNLCQNGIYNVGLIHFNQSESSRKCLKQWKDQCLEWCYDKHEEGRFGDQVYLDSWPKDYGAFVINHLGIDLAPWNQEQYNYCIEDGQLYVDDGRACDPLLHYHFAEFGTLRRGKPVYTNYPLHPVIEKEVYSRYNAEILQCKYG